MKKYEAILFDLDGTLLPMDMDTFSKGYLHSLAGEVEKYGYKEETLLPAMWRGVAAMVKNDGKRTNYDVFWDTFASVLGEKTLSDIPYFDAYYGGKFNEAVKFTSPTPYAKKVVELAKTCADKIILATNPMFPTVAVEARLNWIGLSCRDFDYATDYSNSSYCKPNPYYYTEIMKKMNLDAKNCLMIGNNAQEDAEASLKAGLSAFLLTECLICENSMPECPTGDFDALMEFLKN